MKKARITMIANRSFEEIFADFLRNKVAKGLSKKTLVTYQQHFSAISKHLRSANQPPPPEFLLYGIPLRLIPAGSSDRIYVDEFITHPHKSALRLLHTIRTAMTLKKGGKRRYRRARGAAVWRPVVKHPSRMRAEARWAVDEVRAHQSRNSMAKVSLRGIKKIYPFSGNEEKKSKKKDQAADEKKVNLQITDKGVVAVQDFNLEIADKEFIVLVGPSGCGKSTTLRMVAGLEDISEGELYIGDRLVNDVAPKDRDIAMVFQNYALYPHMTVYENMAFALKLRKLPKAEIDKKVREAAEILDITQYLDRKPKALSGGQRQRVAIGRAIVREPQVFLMDEPLSNLDAKLRNQMRAEIIKLRQRIDTTFIYVTHDQTEAMTLGDRIVIMKDGFIQQIGTPQEVFDSPANLFVAGFIGTPQMNFFDAKLQKAENGDYYVTVNGVDFGLTAEKQQALRDKGVEAQEITLGVRPEHIMLCAEDAQESHIKATVDVSEMMGSSIHLHVNANGQDIVLVLATVDLPEEHRAGFRYGDPVNFTFGGNVMHLFGADGNNLLG